MGDDYTRNLGNYKQKKMIKGFCISLRQKSMAIIWDRRIVHCHEKKSQI